jgi:hypothetical protein
MFGNVRKMKSVAIAQARAVAGSLFGPVGVENSD